MKNILIPLLFFLISYPIAAQIELYVGTDHTVNLNDPVVIRLLDHVGDVQWQRSFNSYEWQDIQDAQADSLYFIADITSYFRAKVTAGHCDPFYSDTTLITVAGETPGQGVIGPEGGVFLMMMRARQFMEPLFTYPLALWKSQPTLKLSRTPVLRTFWRTLWLFL